MAIRFVTVFKEHSSSYSYSGSSYESGNSRGRGRDRPEAVFHARAVIEVLSEAVSKGEMDDVRAQLPAEFARLFEAGSTGQMPAAE